MIIVIVVAWFVYRFVNAATSDVSDKFKHEDIDLDDISEIEQDMSNDMSQAEVENKCSDKLFQVLNLRYHTL